MLYPKKNVWLIKKNIFELIPLLYLKKGIKSWITKNLAVEFSYNFDMSLRIVLQCCVQNLSEKKRKKSYIDWGTIIVNIQDGRRSMTNGASPDSLRSLTRARLAVSPIFCLTKRVLLGVASTRHPVYKNITHTQTTKRQQAYANLFVHKHIQTKTPLTNNRNTNQQPTT